MIIQIEYDQQGNATPLKRPKDKFSGVLMDREFTRMSFNPKFNKDERRREFTEPAMRTLRETLNENFGTTEDIHEKTVEYAID